MRKNAHVIKQLENQLDQAFVKFNNLQAENTGLRKQIDVMRKEKKNQDRVNKGYSHEIKNISDKTKDIHSKSTKSQEYYESQNNHILALKAKAESEKYTFEKKIKELQDKLQEKDDTELEKTKNKGSGNVSNEIQGGNAEGFANPIEILKMRLNKWTSNNKEKKNLMDMYMRNVEILRDAFNHIKQQTGISSTEEIVTTFIKAEEQNYSLFNYVNTLMSETEMIEEQNRQI